MKKFISLLIVFLAFSCFSQVRSMTYEEALKQSKPIAILVYANWADNLVPVQQAFNDASSKYSSYYNFVFLNIASPETKVFNKLYHIYPNLPYVLLFKDKGKISRYIQSNCIIDTSCFNAKLDAFIN